MFWIVGNKQQQEVIMSKVQEMRGVAIAMNGAVGYADDAIISKTLLDKPTGTLTLFSFDAGQGLSEHTAPYDATVLILDGNAAITIAGKTQSVAAGELIIMPANVPHSLRAEERFKMLLIMIR
jgi:quercetin dioxygenase-like cupin family protein